MKIYSVTERQKKKSIIAEEDFETDYLESVNNPKKFWKEKAEATLDWFSNWDEVASSNLEEDAKKTPEDKSSPLKLTEEVEEKK